MTIYEILEKLNIIYQEIEEQAVYTVEQAKKIQKRIEGIGCKNLFLTNKKGKYYLVILEKNKKANIKEIKKLINQSHLSLASNSELNQILNLEQGSVTPFGIIYDNENKVELILDKDLKNKKSFFHPNINTKTISIQFQDLIKFIEYEKHNYIYKMI